MKKLGISILCLILLVSLLPTAAPARAADGAGTQTSVTPVSSIIYLASTTPKAYRSIGNTVYAYYDGYMNGVPMSDLLLSAPPARTGFAKYTKYDSWGYSLSFLPDGTGVSTGVRTVTLEDQTDPSAVYDSGMTVNTLFLRDSKGTMQSLSLSGINIVQVGSAAYSSMNLTSPSELIYAVTRGYYVTITLVELVTNGVHSVGSGAIYVTDISTEPPVPTVPTGVKAASSLEGITVTWDAVSGAAKYRVIRTVDGVTTKVKVYGTAYTDTAVEAGKSYTYSVQAQAADGTYTAASETKSLYYPLGIAVKVSGSKARVSWTAVTGAAKYQVYRRPQVNGKYGDWVLVYSSKGTSFTDTPGAGIWQYRVRAVVDSRKTGYSNRKKVTVG